ncbi:MAG TPA: hypothetical protein VJQ85_07605 [Gaiellaceae bacterium]|nr:hypothetical protein [Gaiellaceae bacterium]
MDVTASFLAGSILSLVLPVGLLIVVGIWWTAIMRRRSGGDA